MSNGVQRLLPVVVPWQVSPSTPFLRLRASEADEPTSVTFMANFPAPQSAGEAGGLGLDRVQVVGPPAEFGAVQEAEDSYFRSVKVTFQRGLWARFMPSYADHEVVEEAAYDWSALPPLMLENFEEENRRFHAVWLESGVCPDPGFYVVSGSRWLQETANTGSCFKHYIIPGHDAYVEVIAEAATWQCEGSEPVVLKAFPEGA